MQTSVLSVSRQLPTAINRQIWQQASLPTYHYHSLHLSNKTANPATGCDRASGNLRCSETPRLAASNCNAGFIIIALYFYITQRAVNRMILLRSESVRIDK